MTKKKTVFLVKSLTNVTDLSVGTTNESKKDDDGDDGAFLMDGSNKTSQKGGRPSLHVTHPNGRF